MSASGSEETTAPPPVPAGAKWGFAAALLLVLLFGVRDVLNGPHPVGDDYAHYLLHAQALADGLPYAETGYLYSSLQWGAGPPLLVPGYSATVALFYAVMGQQDWIPGLISIVSVVLFVGVAGMYFWRLHSPWAGAFVASLVGLMASQVHAAGTPGPDLLFCVMVWVVATLLDEKEGWGWGRTAVVLALALSALTFRLAALPLVPALIGFGLLRLKRSGARILAAGLLAGVGFWWVYSVQGFGSAPPRPDYLVEAIQQFPAAEVEGAEPAGRVAVLRARLPALVRGVFDLQVYPVSNKLVNQLYHVLATLIMGLGLLLWLRRGWRTFALLFLGAYVAMLVLLNFSVPRYLWPFAPAVAFAMWEGGRALYGAAPKRVRAVMPVSALALVLVSVFTILTSPPPRPLMEEPAVQQVLETIEREKVANPDMRLAFFKARAMVWEVGVPTAALFGHAHDDVVLTEVDALGLTHVVVGNMYGEIGLVVEQWRRIVRERSDRFELIESAGDFGVYRVLR